METPGEGTEDTLQARFEAFHEANPHVLRILEELAEEWLRTHRKLGIGMLWEVMRWRLGVQTVRENEDYRLNDHYRSRYARLMIARHPEWADAIETRRLRAA